MPRESSERSGEEAGRQIPIPHGGKLVQQAWAGSGQPPACPALAKPYLTPHRFKTKSLPQSQTETARWPYSQAPRPAWRGPCGRGQALPLDDKLDAIAGFQDLPELGDPEAVGPAEGDAFRQPHHKQLLRVHQELGVGHLDGLRDANGLGCRDMAAVGPPYTAVGLGGHEPWC